MYRVSGKWISFIDTYCCTALREQIGDKGVVLGLSGGVDSSVAAALLSKAVGKQLTCVFVDQGLMRKDEGDFVEQTFTKLFDMNFVRINCQEEFLAKLKGVEEPEEKRHIIGTEFYKVFWNKIREKLRRGLSLHRVQFIPTVSKAVKAMPQKSKHITIRLVCRKILTLHGVIEPLKDLFQG